MGARSFAIYTGWAADGAVPDWAGESLADYPQALTHLRAERGRTPRELPTERAARGFTPARYREGALKVYLYDHHGDEQGTLTGLLMLAGAGRFVSGGGEAVVLYWGGDVYPGLPMPGDHPLAMLVVGAGSVRLVGRRALEGVVAELGVVEGEEWDASGLVDAAIPG